MAVGRRSSRRGSLRRLALCRVALQLHVHCFLLQISVLLGLLGCLGRLGLIVLQGCLHLETFLQIEKGRVL